MASLKESVERIVGDIVSPFTKAIADLKADYEAAKADLEKRVEALEAFVGITPASPPAASAPAPAEVSTATSNAGEASTTGASPTVVEQAKETQHAEAPLKEVTREHTDATGAFKAPPFPRT